MVGDNNGGLVERGASSEVGLLTLVKLEVGNQLLAKGRELDGLGGVDG